MLPAETAVLVHLQSVRCVLLVFHCVVIALFAFGARKCDFYSFTVSSHVRHLHFGIISPVFRSIRQPETKPGLPLRCNCNNLFLGTKKEPSCRGRIIIAQSSPAVKHFFRIFEIFLIYYAAYHTAPQHLVLPELYNFYITLYILCEFNAAFLRKHGRSNIKNGFAAGVARFAELVCRSCICSENACGKFGVGIKL